MSRDMVRITGMNSGLDTESIIKAYTSTTTQNIQKAKNNLQLNKWTQSAWQGMNSKIYSFYSKTLSTNRMSGAYRQKKVTTSNSALSVVAGSGSVDGVQTAQIKGTASAAYLTGATLGNITSGSDNLAEKLGIQEGQQIKFASNDGKEATIQIGGESSDENVTVVNTMDDLVKAFGKQGLNANFDTTNKRLFLSAKTSGTDSDFSVTSDSVETLAKLGLATKAQIDAFNETADESSKITAKAASKIDGSKAKLILNGAEFESNTNTFSINGSTYTINYLPTDTNEKISVTTATDYDGMYDTIKKMLSEYNDLVNEMSKYYNAESAKKYDPLSDEQKEQMTEKEIDEWETKIKDSILRKDSKLYDIIDTMNNATLKGIEIGGEKMYLSDFGIATAGYFEAEKNERYALHIDGDKDDEASAAKDDKLKAMIASDPDKVMEFFTGFANNLYNDLYAKMGSSSLSSIYKVYNDKELATEQKDWEKKVSDLEQKLKDIEDKYYKKFASMEKLLSSINSKQSAVGSYFGQ